MKLKCAVESEKHHGVIMHYFYVSEGEIKVITLCEKHNDTCVGTISYYGRIFYTRQDAEMYLEGKHGI
jgi:hypothetical protein